MADLTLPVAFAFVLSFGADEPPVAQFTEASGIGTQIETETLKEGGAKGVVHQLPGAKNHPDLVLRYGTAPNDSPLLPWIEDTIAGDFDEPIKTKDLYLTLVSDTRETVAIWHFKGAWPMKWSIDRFTASENETAIETLEIFYADLVRLPVAPETKQP